MSEHFRKWSDTMSEHVGKIRFVCVLESRDDVSDKYRWRCPCQKRISLRDGTFFSESRLSLQKWVILMHWWARQYPVTDAAEEAEVTESTASQVYQWFREVCSTKLVNTPIILGGRT